MTITMSITQMAMDGGDGNGNGNGDGDGSGDGRGDGNGDGSGDGNGDGSGDGRGDGSGDGSGDGRGDGSGDGKGDGSGDGSGDAKQRLIESVDGHSFQILSPPEETITSQTPSSQRRGPLAPSSEITQTPITPTISTKSQKDRTPQSSDIVDTIFTPRSVGPSSAFAFEHILNLTKAMEENEALGFKTLFRVESDPELVQNDVFNLPLGNQILRNWTFNEPNAFNLTGAQAQNEINTEEAIGSPAQEIKDESVISDELRPNGIPFLQVKSNAVHMSQNPSIKPVLRDRLPRMDLKKWD